MKTETFSKGAQRTRRVALASRDGKVVHQHFGRATHFVIVDLRDKKVEFIEHRPNAPVCTGGHGEHADDAMERCIDGLSDCQAVVSSLVGPGAVEKLNERGIRAYLSRVEITKTLKLLAEDKLLTAEEFFRTRRHE